jgi:bifunctional non-homologous end joining protein LigD
MTRKSPITKQRASRSFGSQLEVDGRIVALSNVDKVLYPECGFTKGDVIDYYVRVSPYLLPHLAQRPVTLKRFPDGVEGQSFYEKRCPSHRPDWVKRAKVPKSDGSDLHYCVIDGLPALVWVANLAGLELHTFLHKAPKIERPTALALDLDPGAPAGMSECCRIALLLKAVLDSFGLDSYPKTSGSKGLQVYVPLNMPRLTYERTKSFAHALAQLLEQEAPDLVVSKMTKSLRKGKVFIDWSQNDAHKTTINVYSLRAKSRPTVSAPVTWAEVEAGLTSGGAELSFEGEAVLARLAEHGDLFAPVLAQQQKLPSFDARKREEVNPTTRPRRSSTTRRPATSSARRGPRA